MMIYGLFGMSLNLIWGYANIPSFGHAAFFGVGGYAAGILILKVGITNFWLNLLLAIIATRGDRGHPRACRRSACSAWGPAPPTPSTSCWPPSRSASCCPALAIALRPVTGGSTGLSGIPEPDLGFGVQGHVRPSTTTWCSSSASSACSSCTASSTLTTATRCAASTTTRGACRLSATTPGSTSTRRGSSPAVFGGIAGVLFAYFGSTLVPNNLAMVDQRHLLPAGDPRGHHRVLRAAGGRVFYVGVEYLASLYLPDRWPLIFGALIRHHHHGHALEQEPVSGFGRHPRVVEEADTVAAASLRREGDPWRCLKPRTYRCTSAACRACRDVTFGIEPGERLALIGPNGAGKTTLFNVLTGQLKPSGGQVLFKGQDITNASVFARTHLGMSRSFQITSLFPYQSVLVNAMIALQGTREEPLPVLPAAVQRQGAAGRRPGTARVRGRPVGSQGRDRQLAGLRPAAQAGDSAESGQQARTAAARRAELRSHHSRERRDHQAYPGAGLQDHGAHDRPRHGPGVRRGRAGDTAALRRDRLRGHLRRDTLQRDGPGDIYMGSRKQFGPGSVTAMLASQRHPHLVRRQLHPAGRIPGGEGRHRCVALLGRNGMGKTTTIRSIMGLTPPEKGSIRVQRTRNWWACPPTRSPVWASA